MSPVIDVSPDLLEMFKQQVSPVPTAVATDLETLCAALDLLQASGQVDLNTLAGCLSRLSDWLKNQQEAAPDDVSGWTSKPFGVKGMGGMITCRSDQYEVIFNHDDNGQPYLGMWQSRLPGEADRNGSFKIQDSNGEMQLLLKGSRPLQVSLPALGAAVWGSMDTFFQTLNSSRKPNQPEAAQPPPSPMQGLPVLPSAPKIPDLELSQNAIHTIMPTSHVVPQKPPELKHPPFSGNERTLSEQPGNENLNQWQCTCGSKNTGQFCPNCGSEKPTPVIGQKSVLVQPTFCWKCGGVLSFGARFCRYCGAEA